MGKPRRPRGPRSTWEPKPVLDQESVALPESLPDAQPAEASPAEAAGPADEAMPVADPLPPPEPADILPEEPAEILDPVQDAAPAEALPSVPALATDHAAPDVLTPEALPVAPFAPVPRSTAFRIAFAPERLDMAGIGDVIAGYMRDETKAVAAHMRALGEARSPADMIRLQVGEMQRAADASLTCWSTVARKAGRVFSLR